MQHDSQLQPSATPRKGGQIPRSRLLPVMIWIHGGAFIVGNNWQWGMYNQKHLVQEKEIIVVTINYRIGVLGYLVHTYSISLN